VYKNHTKENSKDHTPFVQAMPEEFKIPGDAVTAYRNYINGYKGYAEWRYCEKPDWWDEAKHEPVRKQYLAEREAKRMKRQHDKHQRVQGSLQNTVRV
jgi:thiamine pyrophosphate-dependent acetolactate synthase large subunit-like protein